MARGINKVILIGNLGQDPETRAMPSGSSVTNLRIATSESWKDKQSGEMKERTEWHSVAMFGRLAEIAGEYLRKGSQVYIEEPAHPQVAGQGGPRPLHHRDHRERDADARCARRWRRWRGGSRRWAEWRARSRRGRRVLAGAGHELDRGRSGRRHSVLSH